MAGLQSPSPFPRYALIRTGVLKIAFRTSHCEMSHAAFVCAGPALASLHGSSVSVEVNGILPIRVSPTAPKNWNAREPEKLRLSLTPPLPAAVPCGKCVLLWMRIGHLRLGDNAAVAAASRVRGTVLPVVTVQAQHLSAPLVEAIADISKRLVQLGSNLWVKVVADSIQYETEAVRSLADEFNVRQVLVNAFRGQQQASVSGLRKSGIEVSSFDDSEGTSGQLGASDRWRCAFLSDPPTSFPRVPRSANRLSSDASIGYGSSEAGETAARKKLNRLLISNGMPLSSLLLTLGEEIRLGCIAPSRVASEFSATRQHNCNTTTPQNRNRKWGFVPPFLTTFFANSRKTPTMAALSIAAYDVNGGDRRGVQWDEATQAFVLKEWEHQETERRMRPKERAKEFMRRRRMFFMRAFFPDDVTPDYYSFTAWRFSQRCVSATIGVFGTSSLLFALGIRSGRIGQAAVTSWVLKDGLGRVGKMLWAGSMGKDFDVDPKRWRFRSALLYAIGNGLEIVTQIFPASFLVFATAANSMKQVSMLTSSATRNAMYRSFGGRSQNIANITAKGEAQIVVADLIGMACGIRLSKILSSSRMHIVGTYCILTALDIFGIYMELRQVVFRTLNAERSGLLVSKYVRTGEVLTPSQVSPMERIFLNPRYKSRVRLTSIAKAARNPEELHLLLKLFRREHFIVTSPRSPAGGPCRLVLRKDAKNEDVLRAMLMVGYVRQGMKERGRSGRKKPLTLEEEDSILRNAWKSSKRAFPSFMDGALKAGWNTDNLLFSTLKRRGYWGP